ncbi:MAG: hypothetical protein U0794_22915 [Isosphaeraceae bacterium]
MPPAASTKCPDHPPAEGHYLLNVKDNQPNLRAAIRSIFDRACETDFAGVDSDGHAEVDDGHSGQHEERYVTVIREPRGPAAGMAGRGGGGAGEP